jgi:hypothetical protein
MSQQKFDGFHLRLCVPRSVNFVRVANVKNFRGLDDTTKIECSGFTTDGSPTTDKGMTKYFLTGTFSGGVNLSAIFHRGVPLDHKRNPTTKALIEGKTQKEWSGIQVMLQRNGCSVSPDEIERKVTALAKAKIPYIFFYRLASTYGLKESYGMFKDEWIISSEIPEELDYSMTNKLLSKLKSNWRVLTPEVIRVLNRKALATLFSETPAES